VALKSNTAAEKSKDQLSRDFSGRSIFDFCNNITRIADIALHCRSFCVSGAFAECSKCKLNDGFTMCSFANS
jgi:hypothetical protein